MILICAKLFTVLLATMTPRESASTDVRDATVGLPVTLPCNIGEPTVIAMWFSPANTPLTNDYTSQVLDSRYSVPMGYQRERNLRIVDVQLSDAGNYKCRDARTRALLGDVQLRVNVPPTLQKSADVTVVMGRDVNMTCRLTSGIPKPEIRWFFRGNREEYVLRNDGEILTLRSVTRDQAGVYSCQADNNVPPFARKSIRLDVWFAPRLSLPERVIRQPPATNALLTCIVDANPPGEVYWQRDRDGLRPVVQPQPTQGPSGNAAPPSSIFVDDSTASKFRVQTWTISNDGYVKLVGAFLENLEDKDLGIYTCYVRNEYGSAEVKLSVVAFNDTGSSLPSTDASLQKSSSFNAVVLLGTLLGFVTLVAIALGVALFRQRRSMAFDPTRPTQLYRNCRS